ncbi:MAG: hypothetical protein JNM66_06910 [Bryobacterales bacterium]|nr:hypothetical protein [Bryobacterales bacterium]
MWLRLLLFALIPAAFAAEDGWSKVKALASGAELRITKTGSRAPILAKLDEANDERLIIATKTEQVAIPKEQIEKIEFRPAQKGSRVTRQTTTDNTPLEKEAARPGPGPSRTPGPSGSSSSSVSIGGKPDFEVLWIRGRRN